MLPVFLVLLVLQLQLSLWRLAHTRTAAFSTDDKPVPELPPFAYTPPSYTGPSKASVLSMRKEFMNPAIFHFYKVRVVVVWHDPCP